MNYRYDEEKNKKLRRERGIDFDTLMKDGVILDNIKNTSLLHQNQMVLVVKYNDYCYSIPYVIEKNGTLFLKTAHKDRALNKIYNK